LGKKLSSDVHSQPTAAQRSSICLQATSAHGHGQSGTAAAGTQEASLGLQCSGVQPAGARRQAWPGCIAAVLPSGPWLQCACSRAGVHHSPPSPCSLLGRLGSSCLAHLHPRLLAPRCSASPEARRSCPFFGSSSFRFSHLYCMLGIVLSVMCVV
jgi:hypothetical protein